MAKEENKPLDYQRRLRDTKGVTQRLDLDYLKRPALLKVLRDRLIWSLLALAVVGSVPVVLGIGGSRRVVENGPLSDAHAIFEKRCEACHQQRFGGVTDEACSQCHDGAAHPAKSIDTAHANREVRCVECHVEHRGKTRLALSSANCTTCHRDIASNAVGAKVKNVTAFERDKHPEFRAVTLPDTRPLRLNHAAHMPAEPKAIRGMKLPMKCIDCHVPDTASPTNALMPVTFEQHCKSCHSRELEFDVYQVLGKSVPAPHTKDAKTTREIIVTAYRKRLAEDASVARRPVGNDLAPQPSAGAWLERVVRESEQYLFGRKCGYCHQTGGEGVVQRVNRIQGRFVEAKPEGARWLERGEFSHRAHRAVDCESCHTQARKSTKTEEVLVPSVTSCFQCHGESGTTLDECAMCHLYHNRSLEKERDRRLRELIDPGGKEMMHAYGATHRGRRRENNEDAFHIEEPLGVAILADGMGGEKCGEVGSAITVRAVTEYLTAPEDGLTREESLKEAIRSANRQVIEAARVRTECDGMGSTIVMAAWEGPDVIIANVGDSRAYLFRGGELRQLSYDQNFANELRTKLGFSEERLRTMPNRHVLTMAVGPFEHVLVRTHLERLEPGDRLLLCSDGLHGPVGHETIARLIGQHQELAAAVEALIDCALQNGGPDNVTAVLLEYTDENVTDGHHG